jgi:hypothetical protein
MTDKENSWKFNIVVFILSLMVVTFLTAISFLAAWARDEGQIDPNSEFIKNFVADTYYIFVFPTFYLFWEAISNNSSELYLPALSINVIFWTIITERLVTLYKKVTKNRRLKSNVR